MSHLHTAIDRYHDLCQTGSLAQDSWDIIYPGLRQRHLIFGDRPLCTVIRPMFHTSWSWHYLSTRTALILSVFRKAARAMLDDPKLRACAFLTPMEEELVSLPTGYETNIPTARLDSFFSRHPDGEMTLNFIEFNGESPAGMAYNDVLGELFEDTPLMRTFAQQFHIEPLQSRRHAVDALLRVYQQWSGLSTQKPHVAIVDWAGVPTRGEFTLFADYFARYDIETVICTPEELDFHHDRLFAQGKPVDFVYKRVLTTELIQKYGLQHPIIDAVRAGAICMANPFNCKLLHKKSSFALVSDERNARLFSDTERAAILEHIPWTRLVEQRNTLSAAAEPIDLVPWISEHREELVLKPNDEYGGKGVVIGWETEQQVWDQILQQALTEPYIVQERATIAYEYFPRIDEQGQVDISRRLVDCDPFLYHGQIAGACLTRLSTVTLLNVTAGGGSVVPAFIVDPIR